MRRHEPTPWRALSLLLIASTVSCCTAHATILEFDIPEGSSLKLGEADCWFRCASIPETTVDHLSRAVLEQFHVGDDECGTPLKGTLRIESLLNGLPPIQKALLDGAIERYGKEQDASITIDVQGFYWIYGREMTVRDRLTVNYLRIDSVDVQKLLKGLPLTKSLRVGRQPVYRFELGIACPAP